MKWIKNTWKWLKGKKTNIGTAIMLLAQGVHLFAPDLMSAEQINYLASFGALLSGVGLVDKGIRTDSAQKLFNGKITLKK